MIQEIITYLIVGAALFFLILKVRKRFGKKRNSAVKTNFKSATYSTEHNCADCSAECMLRNTVKPVIENESGLCKKVEVR